MPGALYHSPQRIISAYLIQHHYGIDPNSFVTPAPILAEPLQQFDIPNGVWPIYTGREPDNPDDVIRVIGTQGRDFGYTQIDSERQELDGIQIMIRGLDDGQSYLKAREIALVLDVITEAHISLPLSDVSGTGTSSVAYRIASVSRTSDVLFLGRDSVIGKRILYSLNALVSVRTCHLF